MARAYRLPDGLQEQARRFLQTKDDKGYYFVIDALTNIRLILEIIPANSDISVRPQHMLSQPLLLTRTIATLGKLAVQGTDLQYAPDLRPIDIHYIKCIGKDLRELRDIFDKVARLKRTFQTDPDGSGVSVYESMSNEIKSLQQAFDETIGTVFQRGNQR